jgi:hypothetical protein
LKLIGLLEWICAIGSVTPEHLQEHFEWPETVLNTVGAYFGGAKISDQGVRSKVKALEDLPSRIHSVLGSILEQSASLANFNEEQLMQCQGEVSIEVETKHFGRTLAPTMFRELGCSIEHEADCTASV